MTRLAELRGEPNVYEPAEDSRLLAEAAVDDLDPGLRVLEVGTGSGYVAARVAEEAGCEVVAADLNPHACRRAREAGLPAVRADLTTPFTEGAFDAVLFNPPYLPTPEDEEWDDWMEHALSGGEDGRRVIEPFLEDVARVLKPGGAVYLLVSTLTGVEAVLEFARRHGLDGEELAGEKHPFERLVVLRLITVKH